MRRKKFEARLLAQEVALCIFGPAEGGSGSAAPAGDRAAVSAEQFFDLFDNG